MFKRVAQGLVIALLIIIPVPVGRVFVRLFDRPKRAVAAQVVKRENPTTREP